MGRKKVKLGSDQGVAMIFALIALIILSALSVSFLNLSSKGAKTAQTIIKRTQSWAETEGAIHAAVSSLVQRNSVPELYGSSNKLPINVGDQTIEVTVSNACGRWDINEGDITILNRILNKLGSRTHSDFIQGIKKARAMPNGFQSTNQVLSMPGLEPEIKQRLVSEITLHCRSNAIDKIFASPVLATVIKDSPDTYDYFPPQRIFRLYASNSRGPGTNVSVSAYIEILKDPENPFEILEWKVNE